MQRRRILATLLGLGLAGPALAQQAAEGAAPAGRSVAARDLMTPEERASFRAQMERATPEQRRALWAQKREELSQRASARGMTLAEPGRGRAGSESNGREATRGKGNEHPARMAAAPRAP